MGRITRIEEQENTCDGCYKEIVGEYIDLQENFRGSKESQKSFCSAKCFLAWLIDPERNIDTFFGLASEAMNNYHISIGGELLVELRKLIIGEKE